MNIKIHLAVLLCAVLAVVLAQEKPLPLENLDVENTLKNKKLVDKYVECVLERGRCDSNGRDLKGILPRVLKTNCGDCSPKQKENADRIVDFMKQNRKDDWVAIDAKYGKSG